MKYNFIFVVLVYRNTGDLTEFFDNFTIRNSKVLVVNSYYDDKSEEDFKKIAKKHDADFISVPNKGYGTGNNRGVEYALKFYDFHYLVISNADIIIKDLNFSKVKEYGNVIIAPEIRNANGKRQNPSVPFKPSRLREYLHYQIIRNEHYKLIWLLFIWSRLTKIFFYIICQWKKSIFSAHGAFLIIPKDIIGCLAPMYDERMFLFNEEEHLGRLAASKGIKTLYADDIKIYHKEDGSMKIANINQVKQACQSYKVYYDRWIKMGGYL